MLLRGGRLDAAELPPFCDADVEGEGVWLPLRWLEAEGDLAR